MLKNLPRHYNPPGNGKKDMETAGYANPTEWAILKALGGSGKMTKHGIPSYSWRDDSSSSSNGTQDSRGGSTSSGGGSSGGGGGGLGLTTGKVTGKSAYGPAGGNAVGMGAPGYGSPAETARTLARLQPQVQAPVRQAAPLAVAPVPIPRMKPQVPTTALGPNVGMINTLPQIGGTVPSQIQQQVNGLNYGPTSFPGTPNGPQIGGTNPASMGGGGITSQYQDTTGGGKFGSGSTQSYGSTQSPGGLDRYADMTGGGKFGAGSTQTNGASPAPTTLAGGPRTRDMMPNYGSGPAQDVDALPQRPGQTTPLGWGVPNLPQMAGKDPSRLPGMNGPTPAPSFNPALAPNASYSPQALNDIRRNNGWVPNPVDTPRPENGVQPVNYHTNWNWTGLGQMDKTGQTVTPRTRPNAVPAGFGLRNLPR